MWQVILDNIGVVSLVVLSFVEITPIKISPLEYIGKKLNKQLKDEVDNLREKMNVKIDNLSEEMNTKIDNLRVNQENYHQQQSKIEITNFVLEYQSGVKKTHGQWIAIINLVDEYLNNGWNSKIQLDAIFLKEEYSKLFYDKGGLE